MRVQAAMKGIQQHRQSAGILPRVIAHKQQKVARAVVFCVLAQRCDEVAGKQRDHVFGNT